MIVDASQEHGGFGAFLSSWPSEDQAEEVLVDSVGAIKLKSEFVKKV